MKHRPKTTIIYCLKNPTDRNRIFYVGITTQKLNTRLLGHIHSQTNIKMASIIKSIKEAGNRPTIHELEICTGYLDVYRQERYWVNHYNKRKYKLANSALSSKKTKNTKRVYW